MHLARQTHVDDDRAALLSARALVVGYEGRALLPALEDLAIAPGEAWCVLGRNGAGKTTLLRTLTGLLAPVAGDVARGARLRLGYVPQRSDVDPLVPWRVVDLVGSGADRGLDFLPWRRAPEHASRVRALLEELDLSALAREPYRALSEGQKQRVLLARGLASAPSLLVLDEPTASMDVENERAVFAHLARIRAAGTALLFITHDLAHAADLATHAAFVDKDDKTVRVGEMRAVLRDPHVVKRLGGPLRVLSSDDDGGDT